MEYGPATTPTFEAPNAGPDKPDNKDDSKSSKKKTSESRIDVKQQAKRDLGHSIDRLTLFERPSHDDNEVTNEKKVSASDPIEQLTSSETQHAEQAIAAEHLTEMQQADPQAAAELAPANEFLQRIQAGADIETAFTEAAAEAGLSEDDITAASEMLAETAELSAAAEPDDNEETEGLIDPNQTSEGLVDWSVTNPNEAPPTAGGGRGNNPPPRPPYGPTPGGGSADDAPRATPNGLPSAANAYYYGRRSGNQAVTGVTGYLIGRRRGRIKAEKKLLPVQRKLERQVARLETAITQKERILIKARATKVVTSPGRSPEQPIAPPLERVQLGRRETRIGLQKPERAERLGHVAVGVEAPSKAPERIVVYERPNNIRQAFRPEAVKTMHRNELLELSEKITVEGASLRRIYESRLIGEKQLRHLVGEYLAGKDIRRDLRREMVEHEIDFERDPILRDRVRSRLASPNGGSGLDELLAKAGALPANDDQYDQRQAAADARAEVSQKKANRQRQTADTAMVTAIVVLAVVILVLVLRR